MTSQLAFFAGTFIRRGASGVPIVGQRVFQERWTERERNLQRERNPQLESALVFLRQHPRYILHVSTFVGDLIYLIII